MLTRTNLRMDNATFLSWAEGREGRYELVGGEVMQMMVGVSRGHAILVQRVARELSDQLDESRLMVFTEGFAVEIGKGRIRYPDIGVEPPGGDMKALATSAPVFIAEILSASTAHIDLGDKAAEYLALPSVADYFVLSQDGPKGWRFSRGAGPAPVSLTGRDVVVEIAALGVTLSFERLYRGFPDWVEPDEGRGPR